MTPEYFSCYTVGYDAVTLARVADAGFIPLGVEVVLFLDDAVSTEDAFFFHRTAGAGALVGTWVAFTPEVTLVGSRSHRKSCWSGRVHTGSHAGWVAFTPEVMLVGSRSHQKSRWSGRDHTRSHAGWVAFTPEVMLVGSRSHRKSRWLGRIHTGSHAGWVAFTPEVTLVGSRSHRKSRW